MGLETTSQRDYRSTVISKYGLIDARWFQSSKADRANKAKSHLERSNCSSPVPLLN